MNQVINTPNIPNNIQGHQLPQDIIDACKQISDTAYEVSDPTKYFPINIDNKKAIYERENNFRHLRRTEEEARKLELNEIEGIKYEKLITLMCSGILNVSPMIEDGGRLYSIPLKPENIKESLNITEIIADISLFNLLFESKKHGSDRSIIPFNDNRSKTGERIVGQNCRLFPQGSYSIFDIEGDIPGLIKKEKVCEQLFTKVSDLYFEKNVSSNLEYFIETDLLDEEYGERTLNRVNRFLGFYEGEKGKDFFYSQIKYIFGKIDNDEDWSNEYSDFFQNLKNIENIFSKNKRALIDYISYDDSLAQKHIKSSTKEALSNIILYLRYRIRRLLGIEEIPKYK